MKCTIPKICMFVSVLLLFSGCIKEVDNVKLPDSEKVVLISFLSPVDDKLEVFVLKSLPAIRVIDYNEEGTLQAYTNAIVTISDGENSVQLTYDSWSRSYKSTTDIVSIIEGRTYVVEAEVDGEKTSGSCTIPNEMTLDVDLQVRAGDYSDYVRVLWTDGAVGDTYYRNYLESASVYYNSFTDEYDTSFYEMLYPSETEFVSDKGKDQGLIRSSDFFTYNFGDGEQEVVRHRLYVSDEHYYNYHTSVERNLWNSGDPFAEPVIIYTNITNGLGVVAGYNYASDFEFIEGN